MQPIKKVSERELQCLEALAEHYSEDCDCLYMRSIARITNLTIPQVRRSVRSLARKGLTKYVRGLFDEDGMVAGSGYCCTQEGSDLVRLIYKKREEQPKLF